MAFVSTNPATLERIAEYPAVGAADLLARTEAAGKAFREWSQTPVNVRCELLRRWADEIQKRSATLDLLATAEMGKPITQSRLEVHRCAAGLKLVAERAAEWLGEEPRIIEDAKYAAVRQDPLGVILAVMPWNFPYWQIIRFACGALAAGNTVLIKPAPNTAGCAMALDEAAQAAGFPAGVYSTVLAEVTDLDAVVAHEAVAAVSLTGSVRAGRALATLAAKYGKPAVLELGGSDPFIVLDDADVSATAIAAANARCLNTGQSCICAKRFIAGPKIYPAFREAFVSALKSQRLGDPMDVATDMGPMARGDLRDQLVRQMNESVAQGAKVLLAGGAVEQFGKGHYFSPALLELPGPRTPAWTEETFGPLAALIRADSEERAVELANASQFGLGCSVWTQDPGRARAMAPKLDAGSVYINTATRSHPLLPFGGVKASGMGRELGPEGIRQFTNTKTVFQA